jgi:hypothetical protein
MAHVKTAFAVLIVTACMDKHLESVLPQPRDGKHGFALPSERIHSRFAVLAPGYDDTGGCQNNGRLALGMSAAGIAWVQHRRDEFFRLTGVLRPANGLDLSQSIPVGIAHGIHESLSDDGIDARPTARDQSIARVAEHDAQRFGRLFMLFGQTLIGSRNQHPPR